LRSPFRLHPCGRNAPTRFDGIQSFAVCVVKKLRRAGLSRLATARREPDRNPVNRPARSESGADFFTGTNCRRMRAIRDTVLTASNRRTRRQGRDRPDGEGLLEEVRG
jgi:hypothetical protein